MRKAYLIGSFLQVTEMSTPDSMSIKVTTYDDKQAEVVLSREEWKELMGLAYTARIIDTVPELEPPF